MPSLSALDVSIVLRKGLRDNPVSLQDLDVLAMRERTGNEPCEVAVAVQPHLLAHAFHETDTNLPLSVGDFRRDSDIAAFVYEVVMRVIIFALFEALAHQRSGDFAYWKRTHINRR